MVDTVTAHEEAAQDVEDASQHQAEHYADHGRYTEVDRSIAPCCLRAAAAVREAEAVLAGLEGLVPPVVPVAPPVVAYEEGDILF